VEYKCLIIAAVTCLVEGLGYRICDFMDVYGRIDCVPPSSESESYNRDSTQSQALPSGYLSKGKRPCFPPYLDIISQT